MENKNITVYINIQAHTKTDCDVTLEEIKSLDFYDDVIDMTSSLYPKTHWDFFDPLHIH